MVLVRSYFSTSEVGNDPAYCGLYRQVVFICEWSLRLVLLHVRIMNNKTKDNVGMQGMNIPNLHNNYVYKGNEKENTKIYRNIQRCTEIYSM